uniref:Uncharacterized protein n=1 Tax=Anopheles christyi TaxID=43041 RepID=A0A182K7J7_9DIPT
MSIVANSTVSKKCIICLQCATSMVPLDTTVDIDGVPTSCEIMYSKFTGLQYDPTTLTDEHLSLKLCLACLTQLNSCYLFQRQAIDNFYECFILSYEKLSTEEEASSHHEGNQQTNKLAEICPEFEDDDAVWEDDKKYYDENFVVNNQSPSPEAESFEAVELETETEEVEERHHEEDTGSQNEKAVAENESKQPATSSCVECSKLADQPLACGGAVGQHPSSKQVDGTAEETTLSSSDSGGTMNTKLNRHRCDVCGLHFKQRIALTRHRLR